jgi:glycosyltransferase involved in cell wall biosynthesis
VKKPTSETSAKSEEVLERRAALVLLGAFWPGHEATGPNQSLLSLARALASEFDFRVIARDRPVGATGALVGRGKWIAGEVVHFLYCEARPWGARGLRTAIRSTPHEVMILNGFFDREFTIPALVMRRLGMIARRPTILSPRGEFSAGPAAMAKWRKMLYLFLVRRLGLLEDVWLHATVDGEASDIRRYLPEAKNIIVAPNIRRLDPAWREPLLDATGERPLRVVFLSRIDTKKNLDFALRVLSGLSFPVVFDIYGPITDAGHWRYCQALIAAMPHPVVVRYNGAIANAEVPAILARYDMFFLPTAGENFGHAIFDALSVGLPVLLSDQTPWLDLEENRAGWSLPLDDPKAFARALATLREMDPAARKTLAHGARAMAERAVVGSDAVARSRAMLNAAILDGAPPTTRKDGA